MKPNVYPGKFIVWEGLDGSGQTTQAYLVVEALRKGDRDAIATKEPTEASEAGKRIRDVLDKREVLGALELQRLFAQDRKEHLENTIIPVLQKGIWVVCDRYVFSSLAFGTAAGANFEDVLALNEEFLLPDATFLLKVRPQVCMERIAGRGKSHTLFEQEKTMEKVWSVYETLPAKFPHIHVIDGEQSIEQISKAIWHIISPQLV